MTDPVNKDDTNDTVEAPVEESMDDVTAEAAVEADDVAIG